MIFAPFTGVNHHGQSVTFGCGLLNNERKKSFIWLFQRTKLKTALPMGKKMVEVYTRDMFYKFQDEVYNSLYCGSMMSKEDGHLQFYIVKQTGGSTPIRKVIFDTSNQIAHCNCMMFQPRGIPCRHVMNVVRNVFIDLLPKQYILKRWTRFATKSVVFHHNGIELREDSLMLQPFDRNALLTIANDCLYKAYAYEEAYLFAMDTFVNLQKALEDMVMNTSSAITKEQIFSLPAKVNVHLPNFVETKGSRK